MKLNKLFIGDIYTLNKVNFEYGPYYAPLSLASSIYSISFKKRTLLYKKSDYTFVDLCANDKSEIKDSNEISQVKENQDFVMVNDNLICFKSELLNKGINRNHISKSFVNKMIKKVK